MPRSPPPAPPRVIIWPLSGWDDHCIPLPLQSAEAPFTSPPVCSLCLSASLRQSKPQIKVQHPSRTESKPASDALTIVVANTRLFLRLTNNHDFSSSPSISPDLSDVKPAAARNLWGTIPHKVQIRTMMWIVESSMEHVPGKRCGVVGMPSITSVRDHTILRRPRATAGCDCRLCWFEMRYQWCRSHHPRTSAERRPK